MKRLSVIIVLYFFTLIQLNYTQAQAWQPQSARSMALGHASVTLEDVFAYHHNPGALANASSLAVGFHYQNRFLLRELQTQSFSLVLPISNGVFSLGGQYYGYESFRTNRTGIGYSMLLSENIGLGVQLNYLNLRLDSFYGVRHGVSAELGLLAKVNESVTLGGSIVNIGNTRVSTITDERFGTLIRFGATYHIRPELSMYGEIEQYINAPTHFKTGVEYLIQDFLYVRAGATVQPVNFSFGLGVKRKNWKLDLGSFYHAVIGWTPGVNFSMNLGEK